MAMRMREDLEGLPSTLAADAMESGHYGGIGGEAQPRGTLESREVPVSALPDDVLSDIFRRTDPEDAAVCRLVCKRWRDQAVHVLGLTVGSIADWDRMLPALHRFSNVRSLKLDMAPLALLAEVGRLGWEPPVTPTPSEVVTRVLHCVAASCPLLEQLEVFFGGIEWTASSQLALEHLFRRCQWLERLSLEKCQVATLPETIAGLQRLRTLELLGTPRLSQLPPGLRHLSQLRTLTVHGPGGIDLSPLAALTQVEELTLRSNTLEAPLPGGLWQMTSLESLFVEDMALPLESPSRTFERLSRLTNLEVQSYTLFGESVIGNRDFGRLTALRRLHLSDCLDLEDLTPCLLNLPGLQSLAVIDCDRVRHLPECLGDLTALRSLTVCNAEPALMWLPSSFRHLTGLTHLELSYCDLTVLPFFWRDLSSLTELHLVEAFRDSYTFALVSHPGLASLGSTLRALTLAQHTLSQLPDSLCELRSLEELCVEPSSMKDLPWDLGQLTNLKKLRVRHADQLDQLPPSLGQLSNLQALELEYCEQLEALPNSLGGLTALEHLYLSCCPKLSAIPTWVGDLSCLKSFLLVGNNLVTELPECLGSLPQLSRLELVGCPELRSLPDSLGDLVSLRYLTLQDLPKLTTIPESVYRMSLRKLQVNRWEPSTSQVASTGLR